MEYLENVRYFAQKIGARSWVAEFPDTTREEQISIADELIDVCLYWDRQIMPSGIKAYSRDLELGFNTVYTASMALRDDSDPENIEANLSQLVAANKLIADTVRTIEQEFGINVQPILH